MLNNKSILTRSDISRCIHDLRIHKTPEMNEVTRERLHILLSHPTSANAIWLIKIQRDDYKRNTRGH